MASGSEGEILSEGEVVDKATKAPARSKGYRIDPPSRKSSTSTTSRHSQEPVMMHTRDRSRSPYHAPRGEKRQMADDHYDRRDGRKFKLHYEGDHHSYGRRLTSYDDRDANVPETPAYNDIRNSRDRNSRRQDRDRSRSPYHAARGGNDRQPQRSLHQREYPNTNRPVQGSGARDRVSERAPREHLSNDRASTKNHREHNSKPTSDGNTRNNNAVNGKVNSTWHNATKPAPASVTQHVVPKAPEPEPEPEPLDEEAKIEARRKAREAIKAKYKSNAATPLLSQVLRSEASSAVQSPYVDITTPRDENRSVSPNIVSPGTPNQMSTPGSPMMFEELTNGTQSGAANEVDGPSAADYDPNMDMHEDRAAKEAERVLAAQNAEPTAASEYDEMKDNERRDVLIPVTEPTDRKAKEANMFVESDDDDDFDMFADVDDDDEKTTKPAKAVPLKKGKVLASHLLDNWDDPEGYYKIIQGELINGRYLVKEHLGKGMFANVVRAIDNETGLTVAMKIARNNDTMRKSGIKEIGFLEKLKEHDPTDKHHVVRLLSHFNHKNHLCMVFENLDKDLRALVKAYGRSLGLPLNNVRLFASQMFKALVLLKMCRILHADLKPDNILADEKRSRIKIADLGSASNVADGDITEYLVSRFYRAPEIMLGIQPDFAIDMWSIGCTLFELYTDQILFTGNDNNQMLKVIMECRGKLSKKLIKRGLPAFRQRHFDQYLDRFISWERGGNPPRETYREISISSAPEVGKSIKSRLMKAAIKKNKGKNLTDPGEMKELDNFCSLLEGCLKLDPEERITPGKALLHPFFAPLMPKKGNVFKK